MGAIHDFSNKGFSTIFDKIFGGFKTDDADSNPVDVSQGDVSSASSSIPQDVVDDYISPVVNDNSLSDSGSTGFSGGLGYLLGQGLFGGLTSFANNFLNGALGNTLSQATGDPDYNAALALGDLFTGGAFSANKETRFNNAWLRDFAEDNEAYNRSFAENERDYQRAFAEDERAYQRAFAAEEQAYNRAWAANERDYQRSVDAKNFDLANRTLGHQISQDMWNRDYQMNQMQYLAKDMTKAGLNPLSASGNGGAFASSASAPSVGSGASSPGSSRPGSSPSAQSSRYSSSGSPSLGSMATYSPVANFVFSMLSRKKQLDFDKEVFASDQQFRSHSASMDSLMANIENYRAQTERLSSLNQAIKNAWDNKNSEEALRLESERNDVQKSLVESQKSLNRSQEVVNSSLVGVHKSQARVNEANVDKIKSETKLNNQQLVNAVIAGHMSDAQIEKLLLDMQLSKDELELKKQQLEAMKKDNTWKNVNGSVNAISSVISAINSILRRR